MILDTLPNQYEVLAKKHTFRPWQTGLLADMLCKDLANTRFLNINMGRCAGHTYFTRIAAQSDFPARTKIYLTRQERMSSFSELLFDEDKVHEPIEVLNDDSTRGVSLDVDFIIIDMSEEHARRFKDAIARIVQTMSKDARLILLQANFLNF